ncbi:metal-sensitive transcriptional regulator [Candidatus Bipolaricaulota bacterium]|nr:metal-sensitive transcriptional regulator [Candidatus Bipolaricaulota bacterium]
MTKKGSLTYEADLKANIVQRLRTALGHLAAVERMVEDEQYCIDILKQISAVQASLSKVAYAIADSHMKHCVHEAIVAGKGEVKIDELLETLKYLKHF